MDFFGQTLAAMPITRRIQMEKTVTLTSLGCDKNRVDSEVMLGLLAKDGFRLVALSRMRWRKA